MNWISRIWLNNRQNKIRGILPNHGLCLDVGCGDSPIFDSTVNLDFDARVNPSVCADARFLPFRDEVFNHVYSSEVIEHFSEHYVFYGEVRKVLRTGGKLLITSPKDSCLWNLIWGLWSRTLGRRWLNDHVGLFNVGGMGRFFELKTVGSVNHFLSLVIGEKVG